MGLEIERKWLVNSEDWKVLASGGSFIRQGYLSFGSENSNEVRVRIERHGDQTRATLTIKSHGGLVREENEVSLPLAQAEQLIDLGQGIVIEKMRWRVPVETGHIIEVDEYVGELTGLVVAECEFTGADEAFQPPAFLGEEVTGASDGYRNADLARFGRPMPQERGRTPSP